MFTTFEYPSILGFAQPSDTAGTPTFAVANPADGTLVGHVRDMDLDAARAQIARARQAFPIWSAWTAKDRAAVLRRWYELVVENQEALARLLTSEQGKPLAEARGEITYAASFIAWFAEEARRTYGDIIPTDSNDRRSLAMKQPVGVVAAITPWNFPSAMITRKVAPALAAGCTVVVKPAEATPLSALALQALAHRAGLPEGAMTVITAATPSAIGAELCASPVIRKLSFTGSTAVGKKLMALCAPTVKRLSLELGGNAPFIVFDDADLDAAVAGAIASKFRNAGQTCVCANRMLVQDSVHDAFVERLAAAARTLKVGAGADEGVTLGPLINPEAVAKVQGLVESALAQGARAIVGGHRHAQGENFYAPTVLTDVRPDMDCMTHEIFGPVAPVLKFSDEAEAVALANDTRAGLAAYVYTRDMARSWRVPEALEYGMVGLNTGIMSSETTPFGGIKESGIGREGSRYGIDEYLELKYVCFAGL